MTRHALALTGIIMMLQLRVMYTALVTGTAQAWDLPGARGCQWQLEAAAARWCRWRWQRPPPGGGNLKTKLKLPLASAPASTALGLAGNLNSTTQ
jgi:hypothetical protein